MMVSQNSIRRLISNLLRKRISLSAGDSILLGKEGEEPGDRIHLWRDLACQESLRDLGIMILVQKLEKGQGCLERVKLIFFIKVGEVPMHKSREAIIDVFYVYSKVTS